MSDEQLRRVDAEMTPAIAEKIDAAIAPPIVQINAPGRFCSNRQNEWVMTAALLFVAVILFVSPNSLKLSRFWMMTEYGISQTFVMLFVAAFGVLRALSLYWNGSWRHGAKVRFWCCAAGAVVWTQLMLALIASSTLDAMSLSIGILFALALGEAWSCIRALHDERRG